jgi:hypothetical protein
MCIGGSQLGLNGEEAKETDHDALAVCPPYWKSNAVGVSQISKIEVKY